MVVLKRPEREAEISLLENSEPEYLRQTGATIGFFFWGGVLQSTAQRRLYRESGGRGCPSRSGRKAGHTLFLRVPGALSVVRLDRYHKSGYIRTVSQDSLVLS